MQADNASDIPSVKLDPAHPVTVGSRAIVIPQPSYKIDKLLKNRIADHVEDDYDDEDVAVFAHEDTSASQRQKRGHGSQSQSQSQSQGAFSSIPPVRPRDQQTTGSTTPSGCTRA